MSHTLRSSSIPQTIPLLKAYGHTPYHRPALNLAYHMASSTTTSSSRCSVVRLLGHRLHHSMQGNSPAFVGSVLMLLLITVLIQVLSNVQEAHHHGAAASWHAQMTRGPASDDAAEWAPVPCIPPYCRFRCAARPPNAPQCDAIEQEGPVRITCEIGGIKQTFHNIIFGIPEQEMVACVPEKAFDFAHIIPGDWRTYIFGNSEYEYKRNYRESYYGYTRKKSGWDCNRHYEILASGTMPYFTDLDEAPATVMSLLPKTLIREGMQLPGVNATHIDHAVFDPDAYYSVACRTLAYTRRYLSTKAIARYVLEGMGKPHAKHILLLSSKARADYMREMLVHGMRELLGAGAVDVPALDFLYEFPGGVPPLELKTKELYGNGFSYAHRLPRIDLNRENLTARIAAREFDAVVYGCTDGGLPFIEEVLAHYDPGSIAIVNGEDWHGWTKIQNPEYSQYKLLGKAVHFVRELPNRCPGDEQPATT